MSANNRSPLGFLPILLFHLSVLLTALLLQILHGGRRELFLFTMGVTVVGVLVGAIAYRRFLWDVFRSFKSAGVLLSLLALSCILGTYFVQDLDLRRAGIFASAQDHAPPGQLPPFSERNQATRFALAQSILGMRLGGDEDRERMLEQKVKLSPTERQRLDLHRRAFGERFAAAREQALLGGKERQVNEFATTAYARRHFEGLYSLFRFVKRWHLFDIFEAWWFYCVLGLIAVNVIVGTFARAPWSVRDAGIAITHTGIIIVLAGALLDRLVATEGNIEFVYGDPARQVASFMRDDKNRLLHHFPGFRVRLDRFATEYYHELAVLRYDWSRHNDGSPRSSDDVRSMPFFASDQFPVRAGFARQFEDKTIRLEVKQYEPRVRLQTVVREREDGEPNPAVKLGLYRDREAKGPNFFLVNHIEPWIFARQPERAPEIGGLRFEYVWARSDAEYERLVRRAPLPDNGELVVRLNGEEVHARVDLGRTRNVAVGGKTLRVAFLGIASALVEEENVNLDNRLQRTEEPQLYIHVEGLPQRIRVPRDDREFTKGFAILDGAEFRFDWKDPRDHGVARIYRVVGAAGREPMFVKVGEDGLALARPLKPGEPLALEPGLAWIRLEGSVRSAEEHRVVRVVSDDDFLRSSGGWEDDLLAAWADVEVDGPYGKVAGQLTPFNSIHYGPRGGPPLYEIRMVKTRQARDWFSVLSVLDHQDNVLETHNVQVNSPLRWAGYRFYQATAQPRGPDGFARSGISVTNQPGVYFMYVGYAVLTLGVSWVFFLKPVIVRRQRRRRRAEVAPS
ncbi:MAG: cytochrome c biogenesis protein ResB [Planctomycetota bacterium]